MSTNANPPTIIEYVGDEHNANLVLITSGIFAARHRCAIADIDTLLQFPHLQDEFDAIMDEVACDPLVDVAIIDIAPTDTRAHLARIGLVYPRPIRIVKGVGIAAHRPDYAGHIVAAQAARRGTRA